ncbi:MAG: carbohydrate kinase [Leptospirillia bacterium]
MGSFSPPDDSPLIAQRRIAVLGEVLFDCFPDARRLGGAPFNVAWHLSGLSARPLLISRVGEDAAADEIRHAMRAHGMSTDGLQTDPDHPTGTVRITLDGSGGHDFTILPDQAYDHIDAAALSRLLAESPPELIYFGTLCLRQEESRASIMNAVAACDGIRSLDINLRKDCWTETTLTLALEHATVAKLNDEELGTLADIYGLPDGPEGAAITLRERFDLDGVCVTRGPRGAIWCGKDGTVESAAPKVDIVDTVGAGDSFSAVLILGLLSGWPPADTLHRAAALAAAICERRGACPNDPEFYQAFSRTFAGVRG